MQASEASFVPQAPTLHWAGRRLRDAEPQSRSPTSAGVDAWSGWPDPAHCLLSPGLREQAEGTQLAPSWVRRTRKATPRL